MDRVAWRAAIHGVAKSWTWLSDWTELNWEKIKTSQSIINNAIIEIKTTLERANSRISESEERMSEVEDRLVQINEAERKKENRKELKKKIYEDNLKDLWDNVWCPSIRVMAVLEEKDKKKGHEKILEETTVQNFPKMGKEIATQII